MELKSYIAPLRKWWWLIVASTLIAAVSSYLAVSQQAPIYQARATLLLGSAINNPNPNGTEFWLSQQLAQTYTDIAQRDIVRTSTMESLGLAWLPTYTARAVPDTQLIEITVTDTSPERAMIVANELAKQLIAQTPTSKQEDGGQREGFINAQLDELEAKIEETNAEILSKQEELAGLFSARQIADTQSQIAALEAKQNTLQSNYASLLASTTQGASNTLSVIEEATVPQYPVGPEKLMTVLTSAAIGFSLAVAAAYLLEYLDDTLKSPDDVEAAVTLPTLAGIADFKTNGGGRYDLVTLKQPRAPVSEAYRGLRTALLFTNVDRKVKLVLITSANPGEGKSITSANLGVVLAQAGHRVLIIDADLRRPVQHRIFGLPDTQGLTNLLTGMHTVRNESAVTSSEVISPVSDAVYATQQPGLFVMPSGPIPPNPAELIGSAKMKTLLESAARRFDFVILDSPPILAATDSVILGAGVVDATLLIVGAGSTRRNQLKQAVQQLREVNANVAGVILNRMTAKSGEYYYYYYRSAYYRENSEESSGQGGAGKPVKKKRSERAPRRWPLPDFLARLLS
jgi:non-specific protein-tyrosine kinase